MNNLNNNKSKEHRIGNKKLWQRVLSFIVVFVLVVNPLYSGELFGLFDFSFVMKAKAEEEIPAYTPTNDVSVFSGSTSFNFSNNDTDRVKFVDYCYYYCINKDNTFCNAHKNDSLAINFTTLGESFNFMGLGNASVPFAGRVSFISSGGMSNIELSRALFSHVSTDARLTDNEAVPNDITLEITKNSSASSPILADYVHPGTGNGWKIKVASGNTNDFAGVIGQIEENASVTLVFENASSANIANTATGNNDIKDVGELCGIMKTGSSLTVTDASSARAAVSSANGNAGSLVGKMEGTASLTLSSGYPAFSSVSVTSEKGYAGGLVGEMASTATINGLLSPLAIGGSVTGTTGAGGLFGHYINSASTFDLKDYNITTAVYAENCGGVFGVLENSAGSLTIKNTGNTRSVNVSSGNAATYATTGYFGGIAGKYSTNALSDSLILDAFSLTVASNASFASFGGAIGLVDSAAYIKADGMNITATGTARRDASDYFGGLVGKTAASYGVFIDLGDFTLSADNSGLKGGGVAGNFKNGVLRLSGITDMSGAKSQKGGQLVGVNDNVLVYALGTGTNGTAYETGWTFKRSNGSQVDDLGTWGEVVRISNIENSTNGVLTLDSTNHTVTVKAAQTSIGTQTDLVKTALNIQLNQGSDYDCLKFTSGSANTRSSLLGSTLAITADLSFENTGITGFMRDGSDSIGVFTGTLNGNSHTITLAIGQAYGLTGSGSAVSLSNDGVGQIYTHKLNGLFSVLGNPTANSSATVSDLKVAGSINVRNKVDGMNIGGVAAKNGGNVTLSGVTVGDSTDTMTINYNEITNVSSSADTGKNIGGLIGFVGENGTINIQGLTSVGATINLSGSHQNYNNLGGAIGSVTASTFTVNAGEVGDSSNKLTVKINVNVSGVTAVGNDSNSGGLIGRIKDTGSYGSRIVNVNNVDFNGCTLANASNKNGGGILGYSWLNTTANIKGLTVTSATINNRTTDGAEGGNTDIGAVCYEATGKWVVDSLTVSSLSMPKGGGNSFGMLVNKAYTGSSGAYTGGLYLDVLNSGYTLTAATLTEVTGKYDEIAAYTAESAADILTGGAGVISINMNSSRSGTDVTVTTNGTYSNKLSTFSGKVNDTSRYYYNLDIMNKTENVQNIMLWSVNKYVYTDLADEFDTSLTTTLSGTADMTGLSFYPVALADGISIGDLTLTLDYAGIFAKTGTTMDPAVANQHFLMHSGLFLNSSAGNTLTINGTLALNGNFLEVGKYKGVLISDTMRGTLTCTSGSIVLNGITPKTTAAANYSNGYLLINNIKRADSTVAIPELKLYNVSTGTGYTAGTAVAKSLIGPAVGPGLKMTFSKIKLDGATSTSIFGESTLVKSIKTDQNGQLIYNFTWDDDWGDANSDNNADRNVTYGKELSDSSHSGSVEYADKETKYASGTGTEKHRWFVNPANNTELSAALDFSSYRPYVYQPFTNNTPDTDGYYYREIMVNVEAEGLVYGCGTYNDPYQISTPAQLQSVAAFLKDNALATTLGNVNLPKTKPSSFTSGARWCEDNHGLYEASGTSFIKPTGGADWNRDDVQKYLANAYYKVTTDITLDDFVGLGGTTANTAFRGVIVGSGTNNGDPTVTITNTTDKPFINVSNGCVIKDINFVVANNSIEINQTKRAYNDAYFGYDYSSGNVCKFYGGIIGEIMGGDNIIDNSYVTYNYIDTESNSKTSKIVLKGTDGYGTIVPVGGYVGVVVFGSLIFKNMTVLDTVGEGTVLRANNSHLTVNYTGKSYNLADNSNQEAWAAIYVNPIVGRVINGYAVNETETNNEKGTTGRFSVTENNTYHDDANSGAGSERSGNAHTLKNGKKHYSIADINKSEANKLSFGVMGTNNSVTNIVPANTSTDGTINIPNSQAFFILSLITQSCAGTATSASGDYSTSLSYGTNSTVYGMSHNADYSDVGKLNINITNTDYGYASDDTAANTAVPYIIRWYTADNSNNYPARCVTSSNGYYNINLTAKTTYSVDSYTYQLPDSFRGLGSVGFYDYNTTILNNKYSMKVDSFNGNGCTIDQDIYLNKFETDNYFDTLHKGENQNLDDATNNGIAFTGNTYNNTPPDNHGIGLFDSIILKTRITDFVLTGSVNTEIYSNSYSISNQEKNYVNTKNDNSKVLWLSSGGVCGWIRAGVTGEFSFIDLNDLTVSGADFVGGIIGFSGLSDAKKYFTIKQCNANNISVEMTSARNIESSAKARNGIGCFVGKIQEGAVYIYGTSAMDNNNNLNDYSFVKINSFKFANDSLNYYTAAGGLVGYAGNGCKVYDMKVMPSEGKTVTIGNNNIKFVGGFVGAMQSKDSGGTSGVAVFRNCTVERINLIGNYVGGFYGGKWDSNWTTYSLTFDNCKVIGLSSSHNTIVGNNLDAEGYAGGLIGRLYPYTNIVKVNGKDTVTHNVLIKDCMISNYDITALTTKQSYVGGFIGYANSASNSVTCYLHDSSVENCKLGANGNYAGGIIGQIAYRDKNKAQSNQLLGYNIKLDTITTNAVNKMGAWIGYVTSDNNNNKTSIQFAGLAVYGTGFTKNVGNDATLGTASFVFADYSGASKNFITTTTNSSSAAKQEGDEDSETETFTADSTAKTVSRAVTIVSVGDTETTTETQTTVYPYISVSTADPVSNTSLTENSSVWAVHEDAGTITYTVSDASAQTVTVTTYKLAVSDYNSDDNVVMPKYPYVNVNPQSDMGTDKIISGDGAVLASSASSTAAYSGKTAASTMALKIYEDMYLTDPSADNYSRRYTTFKTYNDDNTGVIYGNNKIDYYMKRTVTDDGDRISNYYSEKGYRSAQAYENFACIVIANNTTAETTALINRYAQLVTNTTTDYAGDDATNDYFDIDVRSCKLQDGKFVADTSVSASANAGLRYSNGEFSLNGAHADSLSSADSFTLVDLQFKDPFDTDKIAYHLYIPVYTIKEMEVDFSVAVMNGTNSASYNDGTETNPYATKLGLTGFDTHIDNLNTWFTTYIRYTYKRDDIEALLDSGNLNWNHDKLFYVDKYENIAVSMLPVNTYMILVDPNGDHDKKYQKSNDYSITNNRITFDITKFKDSDGNDFKVSTFNELIAKKISVTENGSKEGKYNLYTGAGTPSNTGTTHYVYTKDADGNQTYYEYVGSGGRYDLTLPAGDIYENYYISMYVPGAENDSHLYGYYIRTPENFDAPTYASGTNNAETRSVKINCVYVEENKTNTDTENRQVYIGNVFDQTTELTVMPPDLEIDGGNHILNIYAQTTITPKNGNVFAILQGINPNIYHSFNLFLDKKGENGVITNEISGIESSGIDAWYSIGTPIPTDESADMKGFPKIDAGNIDLEDNYINVITGDCSSSISSNGVTIYSRIKLNFDDYESEFPQKVASDTGVSVRATSNLAYDTSSLAFSNMSEPLEEPIASKHIYYRQSLSTASVQYNAITEPDSYDSDGLPSENYSRLGVSGKYSMNDYMPIDTTAQYNVQNIEDALDDADSLLLTLSLQKKTDSPPNTTPYTAAGYQNVSSLNDYWGAVERDGNNEVAPNEATGAPVTDSGTNILIKCGSYEHLITIPSNKTTFTLSIPKETTEIPGYVVDENGYIYIDIGFCAKTGTGFTDYANYKVNLSVKLRDSTEDITGSYADDYLIYTNAKVNHDFLKHN